MTVGLPTYSEPHARRQPLQLKAEVLGVLYLSEEVPVGPEAVHCSGVRHSLEPLMFGVEYADKRVRFAYKSLKV